MFKTVPMVKLLFFVIVFLNHSFSQANEIEHAVGLLKEGKAVALVRHALAPGGGDPVNFDLNDCSSQRNLSEGGRTQAKRIGDFLKNSGIRHVKIYTSQWCRCRETAKLMGFGEVIDLPVLNSFFGNFSQKSTQTDKLKKWLDSEPRDKPIVLITHQVNITAFTGIFPSSGEMIIVSADGNTNSKILMRINIP
jgi:phosphohistidine phosphatase SixA